MVWKYPYEKSLRTYLYINPTFVSPASLRLVLSCDTLSAMNRHHLLATFVMLLVTGILEYRKEKHEAP